MPIGLDCLTPEERTDVPKPLRIIPEQRRPHRTTAFSTHSSRLRVTCADNELSLTYLRISHFSQQGVPYATFFKTAHDVVSSRS